MLFSDDFDEDSFGSAAIELAVEDLFPWSEVQCSGGDGNDDFAAHDLSFHVCIGIVFTGAVVGVSLGRGIEGGEGFEPFPVVFVKPGFVIVDEHGRGDVHGINEHQSFADAALPDNRGDSVGDIDESDAAGNFKGEILGL
ncbi:MAG: hypothetical protein RL215_1149 [Planctomycetota bacterium]